MAFKDDLRDDAKQLVRFAHDANITPMLLSGDIEENTIDTAYNTKIIYKDDRPLLVTSNLKDTILT